MRHVLRILFFTLALVLLGLALAPRAVPAQAAGPCDATRQVPHWWVLRPGEPCDGDSVFVVFQSCRGCVDLTGYERPDSGRLRLDVAMPARCPVTDDCTLDELEVPLGRLARGTHALFYEIHASVAAGDSSAACEFTREASLTFIVCPTPPRGPVCDSLPYVQTVQIGPPVDCGGDEDCVSGICPGEPIPLHVAGAFPNGCYRFAGLDLLPAPEAGPLPAPPIVRLRVTRAVCSPCTQAIVPWSADTVLAGLPGGAYKLGLELVRTDLCNGWPTDTLYCGTRQPFAVRDSCGSTPAPCLVTDWDHSGQVGGCDDFIAPGGRAKVVMTVQSSVPLAGLQGRVRVQPPGLLVAGLAPVGRAADMHLAWERTPEGASFVMFAEQGAPIGGLRCDPGTRCVEPVLAVGMVPDTDAVLPPVTHVTADLLLGADSLGGAVPACEIMTLVVVEARVCAGVSCDFNGDGRLDVRDLVLMVRCLLGTGACPDSALARHDCDGDGASGVGDVLCCARRLLRGGERDSLPGRAEPGVAVGFGEPAWRDGRVRTPVRIAGAERRGAARLELSVPLDRYEVAAAALATADPRWLALHEVVDGRLVLGLVALAPPGDEPATLELSLDLAPRSGAQGGGEVALADLQASGPDGVTLELSTAPASVSLPLPGMTALSAARPNPFSGATRLALALERGAAVDVTVHDLGGRRVATLFHGALPAGVHEFTWSGARTDGSRAAHGVYFVQARVDGERLTRKLVMLRGE